MLPSTQPARLTIPIWVLWAASVSVITPAAMQPTLMSPAISATLAAVELDHQGQPLLSMCISSISGGCQVKQSINIT